MSLKNDITYEYRVFTHRLIDVEAMEVGKCTSKIIKELKPKDKVNGRFFHTSDTDEWFFCWNGKLQKLNLKGDSDVNAALEEVNKLIDEANAAVEEAKKTASEAKDAAADAQTAADNATAAVESIENKADKTVVEELANEVANKVDTSVVEELSNTIEAKVDKTVVEELAQKVNEIPSVDEIALKSEIPSMDEYAKLEDLSDYVKTIDLPKVPTKVSEFENDANYLTSDAADLKYAPIGSEGVDLSSYATKDFVSGEIAKVKVPTKVSELENDANYLTQHQDISGKQDVISDLESIRSGAALGATAIQSIPEEYITETELNNKGYATETFVGEEIKKIVIPEVPSLDEYAKKSDLDGYAKLTDIPSMEEVANKSDLNNYFTKEEINAMLGEITDLIGEATSLTDTILNA